MITIDKKELLEKLKLVQYYLREYCRNGDEELIYLSEDHIDEVIREIEKSEVEGIKMKKEYEGTIRHDYFESTDSFLEWGDIEVEKNGYKQKLHDILFEEYKAGTQVRIVIETKEKE